MDRYDLHIDRYVNRLNDAAREMDLTPEVLRRAAAASRASFASSAPLASSTSSKLEFGVDLPLKSEVLKYTRSQLLQFVVQTLTDDIMGADN